MIHLHLIAGARPNFMKIAPLIREIQKHPEKISYSLIHTGQHYDSAMSDVFFKELGIPDPDKHLDCGGGSHAIQTAKIMVEYEKMAIKNRPDFVVVVGDVNSTLACSIVAKKLNIKVVHVEAGLRSGDREMPEEINRLVTDSITDLFFVTEEAGQTHLLREGQAARKIFFVGHVMVDNLFYQVQKLEEGGESTPISEDYKSGHKKYGVITLHRPSNVDDSETFQRLARALKAISNDLPLVFPVHPRTRQKMADFGIDLGTNVTLLDPQGYMEFLNLWKDSVLVLTDSGGLQEETTALGIPCLTLRENTERPVTVSEGTNQLMGTDTGKIISTAREVIAGITKQGIRPKFWDGKASERIVETIMEES